MIRVLFEDDGIKETGTIEYYGATGEILVDWDKPGDEIAPGVFLARKTIIRREDLTILTPENNPEYFL